MNQQKNNRNIPNILADQNESKGKDKTTKTYNFQATWKDDFLWLEYSQDQGTTMGTMYCKVCKANLIEKNMFRKGCKSTRLNNVRKHAVSDNMHMIIENGTLKYNSRYYNDQSSICNN